jgi:hypothetical protein
MNWFKRAKLNDTLTEYASSIGLNPENLTWMGSGDFGNAYDTGDGRVIKVTSSPSEFNIARQLIGQTGFFAQIYDTKEINGEYVILQEKLEEDSDIENNFYILLNLLEEQGLPIQYLSNLYPDDLSEEGQSQYYEISSFIDAIENICREYRMLGIEASDIRPENLGYDKNGILKTFDMDDKAQ